MYGILYSGESAYENEWLQCVLESFSFHSETAKYPGDTKIPARVDKEEERKKGEVFDFHIVGPNATEWCFCKIVLKTRRAERAIFWVFLYKIICQTFFILNYMRKFLYAKPDPYY